MSQPTVHKADAVQDSERGRADSCGNQTPVPEHAVVVPPKSHAEGDADQGYVCVYVAGAQVGHRHLHQRHRQQARFQPPHEIARHQQRYRRPDQRQPALGKRVPHQQAAPADLVHVFSRLQQVGEPGGCPAQRPTDHRGERNVHQVGGHTSSRRIYPSRPARRGTLLAIEPVCADSRATRLTEDS